MCLKHEMAKWRNGEMVKWHLRDLKMMAKVISYYCSNKIIERFNKFKVRKPGFFFILQILHDLNSSEVLVHVTS